MSEDISDEEFAEFVNKLSVLLKETGIGEIIEDFPREPLTVSPGSEYSLCVWLVDLHGSAIWSYTKQKDANGKSIKYISDFSTGNKQVYVHKADLADARAAGFWRVIT